MAGHSISLRQGAGCERGDQALSPKPVALFAGLDRPTYRPRDLVLLSAVLLPLIFALLMGFATYIWPLMGLPLLR